MNQRLVQTIVELRGKGYTFKNIGDLTGEGEERVRGLYRRHAGKLEAPAEVEDELPTLNDLSRQERERAARQNHERIFRELLQERSQTDTIIEAIRDAIPRVPARDVEPLAVPQLHGGQSQSALLMLSDLHVGAVADLEETGGFGEYNFPTFQRRLAALRDAVRSITLRERHFCEIPELVVASLGDVIENDEIFPAQGSMIDLDLTEQFLCAIDELAVFLVSLLDTFQHIYVPTVTGNHGRIGRKGQRKRHINWDYLVGHMLKAKLERYSARIDIEVPKSPFMVVDIQGYKFLLRHGDGIKSWAGIPYYGISRSVGRWTAIQATTGDRFDYMLMGHFHQPASIPFTAGEVLINGCFPGTTEFSVEVMESLARPMQLFGFVHPQYGLGARYPIYLDRTTHQRAA